MRFRRQRNIACLETIWEKATEDRLNVIPTLALITKTMGSKFSHLTCNTRDELRYNLNLLCKRNYGILYIAFHGSPGKIHLHREKLTLTELAAMMNHRFAGWIVHFGTCSTLRSPREVEHFAEETKIALATGFTRDVEFLESSALELLLFKAFHNFQSPRVMVRHILTKYPDLVDSTGFRYFPEFS
jgi:hypothetical protein